MTEQQSNEPQLPVSIITKADVTRLVHEVEQLDIDLTAVAARSRAGAATQWQPTFSEQLSDYLASNPVELEDAGKRGELVRQLRQLKDTVPVVHMTFAGPADRESLQRLAEWLRGAVHPRAVIAVGLQPDLVGGVYVRTTNHVHDLSLRARLAGNRHLITEQVEAISGSR